jgi:glycosyltransferase involved in cell wall biosynthesis
VAFEPWMRGSHERFLAQWCRLSAHAVRVIGLSGRDWKWRMRSSSLELSQRVAQAGIPAPDVLFASDYVDLPALLGWLPPSWTEIPRIVYFHENQLTYPLQPGAEPSERDLHFGFTNVMSALRASRVVFNSRYHRDDFARAGGELLARMPRPNPRTALRERLAAAEVVAPGIDRGEISLGRGGPAGSPLAVVFNHRWEHDKDPLAFLSAVRRVLQRGAKLELILLGEDFGALPAGTSELLDELAPLIRVRGFLADRAQYAAALGRADVVLSTARHEFFGLAVTEAMAAGCTPLVPHRLSYPELVPGARHARCLYADGDDLVARLERAALDPEVFRAGAERSTLRAATAAFAAETCAEHLDELAAALAHGSGHETSRAPIG